MRPVKLTMQAFGSYGNMTQIDFRKPDQNLFLITGDTGAGKTTIFDAIVFALYGEASSIANKKDGVVLQSQYVEVNVEPFVELIFSEGTGKDSRLYTVRRVPKHLKMLTRGAGKNTGSREVTGSVSLIMPDGTEYPQKEADNKLNEILGLTKSQFMQVVMIAQGEFMELLRAKSDDKKVIFRKLFNTELYQNIVDELMNRKRSMEKDIAQIKTACQTETAHVIIPEEYQMNQEITALKKQINNGEIVVMEQFLTLLENLCETLEANTANAQKKLDLLSKIRDEKRDFHTNAEQLSGLYGQLESATMKLEQCNAVEEQMKENVLLAEQIRLSYEIKGEYVRYCDAQKNVQNCESALTEQQSRLPMLEQNARQAEKAMNQAKILSDQELAAYTSIYDSVNKELKLLKKIESVRLVRKNGQETLAKAQETERKARENLSELERKEKEWRSQLEQLLDVKERRALWNGKKQELTALAEKIREVETYQKNSISQLEEAKKAKSAYIKIRQLYEIKNQEYESARRIFLDDQAGFLAQELQPGKPCPVCGALEHPHPCAISEFHENITRESLEKLEQEISKLRNQQEQRAGAAKAAADLADAREKIWKEGFWKLVLQVIEIKEKFSSALDALPKELTFLENSEESFYEQKLHDEMQEEYLEKVLTEVQAVMQMWRDSVQKQDEQLKKDEQLLISLQTALEHIEEEKTKSRENADIAGQRLTEAIASAKSSDDVLEELERSREYESEEAARLKYKEAKEKKKKAENEFKAAQVQANTASEAFLNCTSLIRRYEKEIPDLQKNCQERKSVYEQILENRRTTEEEWMTTVNSHVKESAGELEKQVNDWKQKRIAALTEKEAAAKAIAGREKPNLENARMEMIEAEEHRIQAQNTLNLYKEQYKADKAALDLLILQLKKRGKIIEKHAKLESLYKLLSGNISGNRMDLETFVQRYYLEKILYSANRRFQDMSAGQFELRMVDAENAGKGKNRGLDLMVYSNVTGKEREVRTLSGGESFMAALALALGMADQIQESSAAINLDVMFVDEGFGSLDEHSREQAVKVLQELASGSKMIGIISHVTELKQEIEDQLIVTKDEKGSHVRWQIS